jgi:hypothetical protein
LRLIELTRCFGLAEVRFQNIPGAQEQKRSSASNQQVREETFQQSLAHRFYPVSGRPKKMNVQRYRLRRRTVPTPESAPPPSSIISQPADVAGILFREVPAEVAAEVVAF